MHNKVIVQGNFAFGKPRSYDQAKKMFHHRTEVYYKSGLLFDEESFDDDSLTLQLPRMVVQTTDKHFKNTVDLLRYLSQFALSGKVGAWMLEEGRLVEFHMIEPSNDKAAVQSYISGKNLIHSKGNEEEAIELLTKSIEKHNEHSQAYERRGYVNMMLENKEDALYDFTKAIKIDKTNADAYLGRARVLISDVSLESAIKDLDMACKTAIAWQATYWTARRLKAECFIKMKEWKKAEFELRLFTKRAFTEDNPNYLWRKWALYQYGNVLLKLDQYDDALVAHNQALEIDEGHGQVDKAEQLIKRGIARQKSGSGGYLSDWKEAAHLGSKQAETLLEGHN
jgi:tetratricopeptide (TPR) repeat protein